MTSNQTSEVHTMINTEMAPGKKASTRSASEQTMGLLVLACTLANMMLSASVCCSNIIRGAIPGAVLAGGLVLVSSAGVSVSIGDLVVAFRDRKPTKGTGASIMLCAFTLCTIIYSVGWR